MQVYENVQIEDLSRYNASEIIGFYLVTQKEMREGKSGYFLRVRLSDRTGSVMAYVWNNVEQISAKFKEGDVVKVKGVVKTYNSQYQITIDKIRTANESEYELENFIAKTSENLGNLCEKLYSYIDSIENTQIKELLKIIFEDKEILKNFTESPAAKNWHHNYIGGLIEHTISVARICDFASSMYSLNRDLLIAGALLHDLGKIYEYGAIPIIEFTDIGRLVGHLSLADQLVCEKAREVNGFSDNLLLKIRHLILSHHGEYEKASVRLPQTVEAIVLHFADNLDAQTVGVKQLIESVKNDEAKWTEFDKLNGRYFYIG